MGMLSFRYQWKLNNIESGLLKVVPQSGTMMPNETQVCISLLNVVTLNNFTAIICYCRVTVGSSIHLM